MTLLQHIINIYFHVCCIVFQWHCCTKFALHEMLEPGPSTWLSFAVPLRHCVMQPIQLVIWHSTGGIREKCVGSIWTRHWCHEISIGILKNDSLLPPLWTFFFSCSQGNWESNNPSNLSWYHEEQNETHIFMIPNKLPKTNTLASETRCLEDDFSFFVWHLFT